MLKIDKFTHKDKNIILTYMEGEYCDYCGRKCDGVHSGNKTNIKEKQILQLTNVIKSYDDQVVEEVIKRISKLKLENNKNILDKN